MILTLVFSLFYYEVLVFWSIYLQMNNFFFFVSETYVIGLIA